VGAWALGACYHKSTSVCAHLERGDVHFPVSLGQQGVLLYKRAVSLRDNLSQGDKGASCNAPPMHRAPQDINKKSLG
jgi:hypothetical protein